MVHKIDLFDPRFVSPLDVLVKDFFNEKSIFDKPDNRNIPHPVDIFEDKDGLTFEIACTGIPKDAINISLEDDILKVSYDKKDLPKKSTGELRYFHSGVKKSSFNLGWKVARRFELSKADAKMDNGLLVITIPYADESKPKSLKIK